MFPLGDPPDYEPTADRSIAGIAAATGTRPVRGALRPCSRPARWLLGAFTNYAEANQDRLAEMIAHPDTVIGLSDGGAHVKMICDASAPDLPAHALGPRPQPGRAPPARDVVHKQSAATAAAVGLTDRGTHRGRARRPTST